MIIGVAREIKNNEYRVGMTPAGVRTLVEDGHTVLVERNAGEGSGLADEDYHRAGAKIVAAGELYASGDLIVKVKEPLPSEYAFLRPGQILFTFLHLAAAPDLARVLCERRVSAVAYETIELENRNLPLLQPMSEIAGRMAVQVGACYLQKDQGGKGVLLAGAPGVRGGRVVVLGGGGAAGSNAVRIAVGIGAEVTAIDIDPGRLAALDERYGNRLRTVIANSQNIEDEVLRADLLIGAVLVPGARTPRLVRAELVRRMTAGSVIVDVAIDQGGCIETIRPTSHEQPVYTLHGVIHYAVPNMPGAVSRTSTFALTNRTLPYVRRLASHGLSAALEDAALAKGINVHGGHLSHPAVAEALGLPWQPFVPDRGADVPPRPE
ncbi:MAG: alanine dehydrogenase [Desulfuromonadales bacterium]